MIGPPIPEITEIAVAPGRLSGQMALVCACLKLSSRFFVSRQIIKLKMSECYELCDISDSVV